MANPKVSPKTTKPPPYTKIPPLRIKTYKWSRKSLPRRNNSKRGKMKTMPKLQSAPNQQLLRLNESPHSPLSYL